MTLPGPGAASPYSKFIPAVQGVDNLLPKDKEIGPYYLGIDVDRSNFSYGIVDHAGKATAYGWLNLEHLDNDWKKVQYVFRQIKVKFREELMRNNYSYRILLMEYIPGSQSGQRGAQAAYAIGVSGMVAIDDVVIAWDISAVVNRSWMSKTVGLNGRKNPSKDQIRDWCHQKWDYLPEIPDHPKKINDCYDSLCIAEAARLGYS